MDLTETIAPRSDQQNFDDYLAGARIVTVSAVTRGTAEQPVNIELVEYPGRPYKPNKSMRRVLVVAWGTDSTAYVGRRMKLVGNPAVVFGGKAVGGIEIEALSHIDKPLSVSLTVTRGRRAPHVVQPLPDAAPSRDWLAELGQTGGDVDAIGALGAAASSAGASGQVMQQIRAAFNKAKKDSEQTADQNGSQS